MASGGHFMGSVLVSSGNQTLLKRAYGFANLTDQTRNTSSTRFLIGSLTKQFTAAEVLRLRDKGLVVLTQPISRYLPDVPKEWTAVTVGELLAHTSGVPDFTEQPTWKTLEATPHSPEDAIHSVSRLPLDFTPGTKFAYSNTNYVLLGLMVAQLTGRSLESAVSTDIFKPLHMTNSGFDEQGSPIPLLATGYQPAGAQLARAPMAPTRVAGGAGAMYSTTDDLLLWSRGLLAGKVVGATSLADMTRNEGGDYGYGFDVSFDNAVKVLHHSGSIDGFNASEYIVPTAKITIFVISNVNGPEPVIISKQLLAEMMGDQVVLPNERKDLPISQDTMREVVGSYNFGHGPTIFADENGALILHGAHTHARLLYQGRQAGREVFWLPNRYMEVDFSGSAEGKANEVTSIEGDIKRKGLRMESSKVALPSSQ